MSPKKKIKINTDSDAAPPDNETQDINSKNEEASAENTDDTGERNDVAAVDPVKELQEKLDAKSEEARENYDKFLRVSAEFDNYKKRSARELEDFRKFANQSLLKEMLSVVDNLELAIHSADENQAGGSSLRRGVGALRLNAFQHALLRIDDVDLGACFLGERVHQRLDQKWLAVGVDIQFFRRGIRRCGKGCREDDQAQWARGENAHHGECLLVDDD